MAIESRWRRTAALWIVTLFLAWAEAGPVHAAVIDFESAPSGSFRTYTEAGVTFSATMELFPPLAEPHFLGVALGGAAGIAPTGTQGLLPVPIAERVPWIEWDDSERTLWPTVRAVFATEARSVSVDVGGYPPLLQSANCDLPEGTYGQRDYFLRAYDHTGRLIGADSLSQACPEYLVAGGVLLFNLGIDAEDIARATGGVGSQTISHVLIGTENELFCPSVSPFPSLPTCSPTDRVLLPYPGSWIDNFAFQLALTEAPPGTVPEPGALLLALLALALAGLFACKAHGATMVALPDPSGGCHRDRASHVPHPSPRTAGRVRYAAPGRSPGGEAVPHALHRRGPRLHRATQPVLSGDGGRRRVS